MARRRGSTVQGSEEQAEARNKHIDNLCSRIKGEFYAVCKRAYSPISTSRIGEGGGGLSPTEAMERADEIHDGLLSLAEGGAIDNPYREVVNLRRENDKLRAELRRLHARSVG